MALDNCAVFHVLRKNGRKNETEKPIAQSQINILKIIVLMGFSQCFPYDNCAIFCAVVLVGVR